MALDRFIYWKDKQPTREEIRQIALNYLGGIGTVSHWEDSLKNRLFIELPGEGIHHLKGIKDAPDWCNAAPGEICRKERFIEIYDGSNSRRPNLDVMTRQADSFTNRVADGLAQILASWWGGTLEPN